MLSPKPCPRNPLYLWRKGDVSRELWRTTCSILLHSGLIWITLWGQSQTLIYKKLMTTYALVLIYTHLRVSIKHHISTGHGGWIDLTLIKDVAVLRITCGICPDVFNIISHHLHPCLSLSGDCWDIRDTRRWARGRVPLLGNYHRKLYKIMTRCWAYPPGAGGITSWLLLRRLMVSEWPVSGDQWSQWASCLAVLAGSSQ